MPGGEVVLHVLVTAFPLANLACSHARLSTAKELEATAKNINEAATGI